MFFSSSFVIEAAAVVRAARSADWAGDDVTRVVSAASARCSASWTYRFMAATGELETRCDGRARRARVRCSPTEIYVKIASGAGRDDTMKIIDVKTYAIQSAIEPPFAFSQGWVRKRSATLAEIVTDEGLSGWGEAFNQGLEPPQISAATIEHALKPLVIGANPLDTEVLWHKMYHATRDYGRKGVVMAAISAIDIGLWDIAGKALRVPVYQLLGGAFRK